MPDRTPAEELTAAADKLDATWWPRDLPPFRDPLAALLREEARLAEHWVRCGRSLTLDIARAINGGGRG